MITTKWQPKRIGAANGQVLLDGPSGLTLTIMPQEARDIAKRLLAAAYEAEAEDLEFIADRQPVVGPS